jgi:ADP-ribose pyrophosphatase YjhB (NUDIX family)
MAAEHEFPKRPVPAVGAVVFRRNEVLLVQRNSEPNRGRWSVPGGALETGETVEEAAVRETLEETSVVVKPLRVFGVRDYIERQEERIRWHYVMMNVLCGYVRGKPVPGSDARDARFTPLGQMNQLDIAPTALEVLQTGVVALLGLGVKDR